MHPLVSVRATEWSVSVDTIEVGTVQFNDIKRPVFLINDGLEITEVDAGRRLDLDTVVSYSGLRRACMFLVEEAAPSR